MAENHQAARFHPPVRYRVAFPAPETHYLAVEAWLPVEGRRDVEVFLPVWIPGSYLIREYSRNIEAISVSDAVGKPLVFAKSSKNRWRVETGGAPEIRFSYQVYCREMSVRTNWVEAQFALINGAPTFVTLPECLTHPHEIGFVLSKPWQATMTGLPAAPDGQPHHYVAENYDMLVDSPILCGNPAVYEFGVDGIPHFLVNEGEAAVWDGPRSAADAEKIVRRHKALWGALPYTKYVFLNLLNEANGGLEHRNSMCVMTSRWATRTQRSYLNWLHLVSHEFFHVWNIKLLRPVELGPFDYENENYTRSLWVAEGITDYYGPLTVRRAGLSTTDEYLAALSEVIRLLQSTPGRQAQSVEEASWDAWIKLYRPDENSVNSTISYYVKGAVVAWLLDARLRKITKQSQSLDDLMRLALARFAGERGFTPEDFKALASEAAGADLSDFFRHTVESTEELDYSEALEWFGLQFKPQEKSKTSGLGAETRIDNGRILVTKVPRDSAAWQAGLNADDEVVAIDDFRVRPEQLAPRLECYRPGDKVSILISRRDLVSRVELTLAAEPPRWQLEIRQDSTILQKQNLAKWLEL
jgi:predicted metalloprotease with PDZ domain